MKAARFWLLLLTLLAGCWPAWPEPRPAPEPLIIPQATAEPGEATPLPETPPVVTTAASLPTLSPTPLPVARDDLNVLLLGTDYRLRDPGGKRAWRTDTLIVVGLRPRSGVVAMLSIPRDLWVTIPGYGEERINVADCLGERRGGPGGGPALVGATLQENLGIPIHAYARINFQGLERVIDTVGGITITSDRAFSTWMDDWTGEHMVHIEVVTGTQRMDGLTALGYARDRSDTSDLDRTRRQQEILLALRDAVLRPEILPRLPALLRALPDAVDTDLSLGQVLSLVGLALRLGPESYRGKVFDHTMLTDWVTPEGAMVLLPKRPRVEQVWAELTAPPSAPR
jgi:LCP family protein required for cell wall assembly